MPVFSGLCSARSLRVRETSHKMAVSTADPIFSVNVQAYSDPNEPRPSDEQAIVFDIEKETPVKDYVNELNKHFMNLKSFLYASRISGGRCCVVMSTAEQATKLVEQVGYVTVNGNKSQIKFYVAKSVKVIISNAAYSITNSALKKFLVKDCNIRTSSSVSEFKINMGSDEDNSAGIKSFRRFIYIHPDDVDKIPNKPVRFYSGSNGCNVFFELDKPKCFRCFGTGHFQANCPENDSSSSEKEVVENENGSAVSMGQQAENVNNESTSDSQWHSVNKRRKTKGAGDYETTNTDNFAKDNSIQMQIPPFSSFELATTPPASSPIKRALSESSGVTTVNSAVIDQLDELGDFLNPNDLSNLTQAKQKKQVRVPLKKPKVQTKLSTEELVFKISSDLESARPIIEATESAHGFKFDALVDLVVNASSLNRKKRKALILTSTKKSMELLELLRKFKGIVKGQGINSRIRALINAFDAPEDESPTSELSLFSDSE